MPLTVGDLIDVAVEKPAAGGRMIARRKGEVVFVAGAIPGERVTARVIRAGRQVAFADTEAVLAPSADRREPNRDVACGGCVYAHIQYPRQVELKADVIRDAFIRIGRIPLDQPVIVRAAHEHGYRMRARFHVREGRALFYREGSHDTCDPRQTGQLSSDAVDAVDAALGSFRVDGITALSVELSENIAADQRALHMEVAGAPADLSSALTGAVDRGRLTGATASSPDGRTAAAGDPIVTDTLSALTDGRTQTGVLRRHPQAFFQGNRFLISSLVNAVLDVVPPGPVVDLYAGVGLFAVALAASGQADVTAVEGSPVSAGDLERNAAQFDERLHVTRGSVESYLQRTRTKTTETLIVDPPRTGMSKAASESIARCGVPRIVYVSCDPPTLARDARRLVDAGYRLSTVQGFDLFPNTAHVEALAVFDRLP